MSVLMTAIEIEDSNIPLRRAAQIIKEGMQAMAHEHRLETMGKHFKKNAETAPGGGYGYVPRSSRYLQRKIRKVGHDTPNVLTGRLMRESKSNSFVTATQYKSTVHFRFSRAIKDEQRAELTAVTPEEQKAAQNTGRNYVRNQFFDRKNWLKRKRKVTSN